jgi:hypothetical protein
LATISSVRCELTDELGASTLAPKEGSRSTNLAAGGQGRHEASLKCRTDSREYDRCRQSVTIGRGLQPARWRRAARLAHVHGRIDRLRAAVGRSAAIAAPDRKVIALEGDGSGMYTLQALWTMARENLDVTVVIFANRSYQITVANSQASVRERLDRAPMTC